MFGRRVLFFDWFGLNAEKKRERTRGKEGSTSSLGFKFENDSTAGTELGAVQMNEWRSLRSRHQDTVWRAKILISIDG